MNQIFYEYFDKLIVVYLDDIQVYNSLSIRLTYSVGL